MSHEEAFPELSAVALDAVPPEVASAVRARMLPHAPNADRSSRQWSRRLPYWASWLHRRR